MKKTILCFLPMWVFAVAAFVMQLVTYRYFIMILFLPQLLILLAEMGTITVLLFLTNVRKTTLFIHPFVFLILLVELVLYFVSGYLMSGDALTLSCAIITMMTQVMYFVGALIYRNTPDPIAPQKPVDEF